MAREYQQSGEPTVTTKDAKNGYMEIECKYSKLAQLSICFHKYWMLKLQLSCLGGATDRTQASKSHLIPLKICPFLNGVT